jgi:acyl-CoA thioesterase I
MLATVAVSAHAANRNILVFGDSISAGYGVDVQQAWVARLQKKLNSEEYGYVVVNASVSGETTAGGLARLPRALRVQAPVIVILELGANDGLRALPIPQMRSNLERMIDLIQAAHAKVLLVGMRIPPNYGPQYTAQFYETYDELAKAHHVAWVPFLLDHVALNADRMQADGMHPNESGQQQLLDNVWPQLAPLLKRP